MDESDDGQAPLGTGDSDINQLLGLFDAPAFVRRGQDLEYALGRLHVRCRRERAERLDMVRVRLRQWAAVAREPSGACLTFPGTLDALVAQSGAQSIEWGAREASLRRRRAVARDLIAAVSRFNTRWLQLLDELNLERVNHLIDQYNRYYVLEKECSLGSAKLAARHFVPRVRITRETLLAEYPLLAVPELIRPPL